MSKNEYDSIYDRVFDIYKDALEHLDVIDRTNDEARIRQTALDLKNNISDFLYALEATTPEEG